MLQNSIRWHLLPSQPFNLWLLPPPPLLLLVTCTATCRTPCWSHACTMLQVIERHHHLHRSSSSSSNPRTTYFLPQLSHPGAFPQAAAAASRAVHAANERIDAVGVAQRLKTAFWLCCWKV